MVVFTIERFDSSVNCLHVAFLPGTGKQMLLCLGLRGNSLSSSVVSSLLLKVVPEASPAPGI